MGHVFSLCSRLFSLLKKQQNKALIKIDARVPSTPGIGFPASHRISCCNPDCCCSPFSTHSQENKIRLLRLWKGKANQPTNIWRRVIWGILEERSFLTLAQENYLYFQFFFLNIPNIISASSGSLVFLLTHLPFEIFPMPPTHTSFILLESILEPSARPVGFIWIF